MKRIAMIILAAILFTVQTGRASAQQNVPTVQLIYLVTSDGADYHREKQILATATAANNWLAKQTDGYKLRISPNVERITIPESNADLLASGPYWVIKAALIDRFENSDTLMVVYVDLYYNGNGVCGESDHRLAVIYPSNCYGHRDVFRQMLFLHETFHALGLVPYCANNHDNRRIGHVSDSHDDLMYKHLDDNYAVLDVGHDDYYLNPDPECPGLLSSKFITKGE